VIFEQYSTIISMEHDFSKISQHSQIFVTLKQWKCHWLAYITANVQSVQTEPWSLYTPFVDQFIHNELLECSLSLKQMLLQLRH